MQSIMIATTNTQKKPTPIFNYFPYLQNPIKIQLYQKLYKYFSKKHGKTIQIFHTLYKLYKSLGTEKRSHVIKFTHLNNQIKISKMWNNLKHAFCLSKIFLKKTQAKVHFNYNHHTFNYNMSSKNTYFVQ